MSRRGRHGRHPHPAPTRPGGPAPERATGAADARPGEARAVTPVDTIAPPVTGGDVAERLPAPETAPVPLAQPVVVPAAPAAPELARQPVAPIAPVAVAEHQPMAQATD